MGDSCPKYSFPPESGTEQSNNAIKGILKMTGASKCTTAGGSELFGVFKASFSSGCDSMSAAASSYNSSSQHISCIINKSSSKTTQTVTSSQMIKVSIGPNAVLANGLTIDEKTNATMINTTSITAKNKSDISTSLQNTATEAFKNIQENNTDFMATPQGSKSLQLVLRDIKDVSFNENVSKAVIKVMMKYDGKQVIDVEIGSGVLIGGPVTISQNMIIKLASAEIMNTASTVLDTMKSVQDFRDLFSNFQKNKNKGPKSLFGQLFGGGLGGILTIVAVVIGILLLFYFGGMDMVKKYAPLIIMTGSLIVAVIYGLKSDWVVTSIAGVIFLISGGYELYILSGKGKTGKVGKLGKITKAAEIAAV
jgi:hypothetical protein